MSKRLRYIGIVTISGVIFLFSCSPESDISIPSAETSTTDLLIQSAHADTVTVFLTGNILSTLKPCGCTTGQLGGLDRRPAVLSTAPADRRLIIDTGNFLRQDTPQDRIKLGILLQALTLLEYNLVHFESNDLQLISEMGLMDTLSCETIAPGSSEIGPTFERTFTISDRELVVQVATVSVRDFEQTNLSQLFDSQRDTANVILLIVDSAETDFINRIAATNRVDVIIVPATATEPRIVDRSRKKPLVISVGKFGEYVTRLLLQVKPDNTVAIGFSDIAIVESYPSDEALVDLYKFYQTLVRDEGLLDKVPQVPLPDGLQYTGSKKCQTCHEYEYAQWSTKLHAKAYPTLVKVDHQYDPECVQCHVIGLGYETGFKNESSPEDLRNVGCESCHGPGSQHIESVLTQKNYVSTGQPRSKCTDCHTTEHSPKFYGNEKEYFQKIIHWKEHTWETSVK